MFRWVCWWGVLMLAAAGPLRAGERPDPPTTAYLETTSCHKALWDEQRDPAELMLRMKGRAGQVRGNERGALVSAVKGDFWRSLTTGVTGRRRLFSDEPGLIRERLLEVLGGLGERITSEDVEKMLPAPGGADGARLDDMQTAAFVGFARARWGANCTRRLTALLDDKPVVARPATFLAFVWLGCGALPEAGRPLLSAALDRAYLKQKQLADPTIASIYRPLCAAPWSAARSGTMPGDLRTSVLRSLAAHLFRLPVLDKAAGRPAQLTEHEYLGVAAHGPPALKWTAKLAGQLKPAEGRNNRGRGLLARFVTGAGDHFGVVARIAGYDVDYFVYLHTRRGAADRGPWNVLDERPANFDRSVALLKELFAFERRDRWTVPLLDVLARDYYPSRGELFESVLRPIARRRRELAAHPVRRELLSRVLRATFPSGRQNWQQRWTLAWDAAGDDGSKLLDPVPITGAQPGVIEFLGGVCRGLPVPSAPSQALAQVNRTYGRLLGHVYVRLFERRRPDAALGDATVVGELTRVFGRLAALRRQFGWRAEQLESVNKFWERVEKAFEAAAAAKDRPKMVAILRLMLRICAVLGDPEPVRHLAEAVCHQVFGVSSSVPFRVLDDKTLGDQAALFKEIAPAIRDAVQAVRSEAAPRGAGVGPARQKAFDDAIDGIVGLFKDNLYLPVIRTDRFLARVGSGPWRDLMACYENALRMQRAYGGLIDHLAQIPFVNAPDQVLDLVRGYHDLLHVEIWYEPGRLRLSENTNLALLKKLLDAKAAELQAKGSRPEEVLDVIRSALGRDALWIESCTYDRNGDRTSVKHFERATLIPYLTGLLALHEARAAPFLALGGEPCDPTSKTAEYAYDPKTGPRFKLPKGRWTRRGVSGRCRLALYEALAALPGNAALKRRLDLADIALMLPNRAGHTVKAEEGRLGAYAALKRRVLDKLRSSLDDAGGAEFRFRTLQAMVRLRYSFGAAAPEPSAAFQDAVGKLPKDLQQALVYEQYFLQLANEGAFDDLARRVQLLINMLQQRRDADRPDNPAGRLFALQDRSANAGTYLGRVGQADVVAFSPVLDALGAGGAIEPELGEQILWAFALALPYYGNRPDLFVRGPQPTKGKADGGQWLDRLILFSRLTAVSKGRLGAWATAAKDGKLSGPIQAQVRQLLVQHNNVAIGLAGRVFETRELLKAAYREKPYTAETIDFRILYRRRTEFKLDARELLEGAVAGCQQNFTLARHGAGAAAVEDDEAVVQFLFEGVSWGGEAASTRAPSLDDVIRTCARVAKDPRYRDDPDKDVKAAALAFQGAAGEFIENPPSLTWFQGAGARPLRQAETYFVLAEMAGQKIVSGGWPSWALPEAVTGDRAALAREWEREARCAHATLWRMLLLGREDVPPWKQAFVRSFCAPSEAGESRAQSWRVQRARMDRLVDGDAKARPAFGGLKQTLATLRNLEKDAPQSPGVEYLRAYWRAAQAVLHAAQVGEGAAGQPFLAEPFVTKPGGPVRPLTAEDFAPRAEKDKDWLFEALDWPMRWDDRCGDEVRLRDLVGRPLAMDTPRGPGSRGLGGGNLDPTKAKPKSYRHASWLSMSAYAGNVLRGPVKELDASSKAIEAARARSLGESLRRTHAEHGGVCRCVLAIVDFRKRHNEVIDDFCDRSAKRSATKEGAAGRADAWAWYQVDKVTVAWGKELVTKDRWLPLCSVWAPFERYATLRGLTEPPALGLVEDAWEAVDDARLWEYSLVYLLSLIDLPNGGPGDRQERLSPGVAAAYEAVLRDAPDGLAVDRLPKNCIKGVLRWTCLASWGPLCNVEHQEVVCRVGGYSFSAVKADAIEKVGGKQVRRLGKTALDLCSWREDPSPEWLARYAKKMELVNDCWVAAGGPRGPVDAVVRRAASILLFPLLPWADDPVGARSHRWVSGLDVLRSLACRAEPCASPYRPELRNGRIYFTQAGSGKPPTELRRDAKKDPDEVLRLLDSRCLLQRVVGSRGTPRVVEAGFMGYVDLLGDLSRRTTEGK